MVHRREALRNLVLAAAGISLFPACDFEEIPVFSRIPLEKKQYKSLAQLADYILPKKDVPIETPESTVDYILTVINDCYSQKDLNSFISGFEEFQNHIDTDIKKKLHKLEPVEVEVMLDHLAQSPNRSEMLVSFYDTTKQLTIQHFTTSEYFLKNYLDFEFAPARYLGCVDVPA